MLLLHCGRLGRCPALLGPGSLTWLMVVHPDQPVEAGSLINIYNVNTQYLHLEISSINERMYVYIYIWYKYIYIHLNMYIHYIVVCLHTSQVLQDCILRRVFFFCDLCSYKIQKILDSKVPAFVEDILVLRRVPNSRVGRLCC